MNRRTNSEAVSRRLLSRRTALMLLGAAAVSNAACGYACGFVGNTDRLLQEQFNPTVLLKKYEWFKDSAAALDKKTADIKLYQTKLSRLTEDYPVGQRPRDVREQLAIWESELAGIKASYNSLAAEYNAQMSKANYAFTNVGMLPQGATVPLPREYKPYVED